MTGSEPGGTQPDPDRGALDAFVAEFRQSSGYRGDVGHFAFDDTPEVQTLLGRLVLEGPKRATAGLAADHEEDRPAVGQHDAVLDGSGSPLCIIRTDELRTLPFSERDPAFAWDEGEDDRTLPAWTDVHVRYFTRRAERMGAAFTEDSLVNFERFSVVWPELQPPPPVLDEGSLSVRPVRPDDRPWVRSVTGDVTSDDGWPTGRCPALLARHDGRTAGVLVFVPTGGRTEVAATAVLEDIEDTEGVESALSGALERLRRTYGWGPISN